jgi:hypothetical protein
MTGNFLQAVREAAFVGGTWVLAAMFPLVISDNSAGTWWKILIGFCFVFFAVDAIRYGTRRRIVVRVVIPLSLLALSCTLYWSWIWLSK